MYTHTYIAYRPVLSEGPRQTEATRWPRKTGIRKRPARKADGKLACLENLGGSWREQLTLLVMNEFDVSFNFACFWGNIQSMKKAYHRRTTCLDIYIYIYIQYFYYIDILYRNKEVHNICPVLGGGPRQIDRTIRHRPNRYLARRAPGRFLAGSFRNCFNRAVLKCRFSWRTRYTLS